MISNFTKAEWNALLSAVVLQQTEWEQNGNAFGRPAPRELSALDRAVTKARQLAPVKGKR